MNRENMDPFCLDPIDPPAEVTNAADLMLWRGLCPWCGTAGPFAPARTDDESLICRTCGLDFLGPVNDQSGQAPERTVTAVYDEGDAGMRLASADDLPELTARP
jgi:hypothetical protein